MRREVDSQRQRVYDAEIASGYGWLGSFQSVEPAQWWVDRILKSDWWKKRSKVKKVIVIYNYKTVWCSSIKIDNNTWEIILGCAGLCQGFALHELAHVLAPEAEHGPDFAFRELELYERWAPEPAPMRLKEAFIRYKVDM